MSTSTITSRKSCGTSASASTIESWRQPLEHALLVRVLVGHLRLELVVEEVVAGLAVERRRLRRALLAAAAVDVQVREDPEQPGAQVRARRVLPPGAERALVGLLDEVLGLLAGADEPAGHAIDLIAQLQRLLLEANAIPRVAGEPPGIGGRRWAVAHPADHPSNGLNDVLAAPDSRNRPLTDERANEPPEVRPWKARTSSRATTTSSEPSSRSRGFVDRRDRPHVQDTASRRFRDRLSLHEHEDGVRATVGKDVGFTTSAEGSTGDTFDRVRREDALRIDRR